MPSRELFDPALKVLDAYLVIGAAVAALKHFLQRLGAVGVCLPAQVLPGAVLHLVALPSQPSPPQLPDGSRLTDRPEKF